VAAHGFAVNVATVIVLAGIGAGLVTGRAVIARPAALMAIALCVTDWVLVQDLGFLGGHGTDPNSMPPQALLLTAMLVAMAADATPVTVDGKLLRERSAETAPASRLPTLPVNALAGRRRRLLGRAVRNLGVALGMASTSSVLTLWAGAMVLLGVVPMAVAAVQRGPAQVVSAPHTHAAGAIRSAIAAPICDRRDIATRGDPALRGRSW
jgi:hypothetical protein